MSELYPFSTIRDKIQPGDIIAFGGNSLFSKWAKFTSGGDVTHVAIVLKTDEWDDIAQRHFHHIAESTFYQGREGVMINRLGERIENYQGDVWWLPLSDTARLTFELNLPQFIAFIERQEGLPYDIMQLFGAAIDWFDTHPWLSGFTYNEEDLSSWFCSELVAKGLERAGVVKDVNASEVTPVDVCRFSIFHDALVQIKGEYKAIDGYNSLEANAWGQRD